MAPAASTLSARFAQALTGAKGGETQRVVLSFFALHFLLISYYLIKPLRNSQFLKEFDPDFLPIVSFGVVSCSFVLTKLFSFLADRVEKYRLVTGSYLAIIAAKLGFAWWLSHGGKTAVVAFYFFASVYFLLAIATMWACANDIFTPDQGERCFGFIAVGSTTGGIVGSALSRLVSDSSWRDYAPACSGVSMAIALSLILLAARRRRVERRSQEPTAGSSPPGPRPEFWNDVAEILRRPYVRRIGTMVMVLAVYNTSLDYISNRAIDQGVTRQQFTRLFPYLPEADYQTIYELKQLSPEERQRELGALAQRVGQPAETLQSAYQQYQNDNERQSRNLFSDVYQYQGVFGIALLLLVARYVFAHVGLRFATIILPVLAGLSVVAFAFPLGLLAIQMIMVVLGAANYSLNNAAKEILYTASDEETKFKYKPLIEGPGMRMGDVVAALAAMACQAAADVLGWSEHAGHIILLLLLFAGVGLWFRAAYLAGKEYDFERRLR